MASGSLHRLNNLFIHLLDALGAEKQPVQPAPNRAPALRRATPGLIVAVLVWSLVFVLSVGTNGALAAALAQHLTMPPGLVDAFSRLAGQRDTDTERDLAAVVPAQVPDIDQFEHSGPHPHPVAANGSPLVSSILAHIPNRSPDHGGLLGLDFMHALANAHSQYVGIDAHPDAWSRGGAANRVGITDPGHPGRRVRARSGDAVSDERANDGHAPASQIVLAPHVNEPTIDSVPWAESTPDTGPASTQPEDTLGTLDDVLSTLAHRPTSPTNDDVPPTDSVLAPLLAVDLAQPAAALAATSVPAPGTMGLLAATLLAWPVAKRMRIGSARRTR